MQRCCWGSVTRISCRHAIVGKHEVIHKTGSTQLIATPPVENRVTATGDVHKICWSLNVWYVIYACAWTDKQTDTFTTILRFPTSVFVCVYTKCSGTDCFADLPRSCCCCCCCSDLLTPPCRLQQHLYVFIDESFTFRLQFIVAFVKHQWKARGLCTLP